MHKRVERNAMLGRHGVRYSWEYWAAIVATFAFLIVDIFDDGAIWNYAVIVCIIIAMVVRPGGFRGRRAAAGGRRGAARARGGGGGGDNPARGPGAGAEAPPPRPT